MDWFDELKRNRIIGAMDDAMPTIIEGITDVNMDKLFTEVESLRRQLAAKDTTICGMREEIASALSSLRSDHIVPNLFRLGALGSQGVCDAIRILEKAKALSSSPTCPHKKRAAGITQAEWAGQVRLINERDEAKKEAQRLFSPMPCGHPWACYSPLGPADNQLVADDLVNCLSCRAIIHLQEEVEKLKAFLGDASPKSKAAWERNEKQIADHQAALASLREVVKAVKNVVWRGDIKGWRSAQNKVESLLFTHESKWGKVEDGGKNK